MPYYPHPPFLSPAGSSVRFKDAMPSYATLAQPWRQLSVAAHTQSPLWDTILSKLGPCSPLRCPTCGYVCGACGPACTVSGSLASDPQPISLIQTIRLSYVIQFARRPPKFRGIQFTSRLAKDAPALRAEIAVLLVKNAIEPVPPTDTKTGFYSPYFIVPKKGGG